MRVRLTTPVGIDWHGTCERGEVREKSGSRVEKYFCSADTLRRFKRALSPVLVATAGRNQGRKRR